MPRSIGLALALLFLTTSVRAQSFEAGVIVATSQWSEFDGTDLGVGGRLTWMPTSLVGVDANFTWYPADYPRDGIAFSGNRLEGLFGVTVGPHLGRARPFVKAAAGFLAASDAPAAFPCIAIFPPPLLCLMASGHTLPAFEIGGGVDVTATSTTFLRVDVADRVLKYPGPSLGADFRAREAGFYGHAVRFTIGGGVRF